MYPYVSGWVPSFARARGLGQAAVSPAVPVATAPVPAHGGPTAAGLVLGAGASVVTLAIMGVSVAFMYGVARESKSSLVKTTGYILAAGGALIGLIDAAAVGIGVAAAASRSAMGR